MKKVLLSFLMVFFSIALFAQKSATVMTKEQVRVELAKGMVKFVNAVKPAYLKKQTQQDFAKAVCGTWTPTGQGTDLLKKAYEFLGKATTPESIINSYSGKEMAAAVIYLKKVRDSNPKSDASEIFGGKTGGADNVLAREAGEGCKWYQLWCHIESFSNWVIDNWETIQGILVFITSL